MSELPHLTESEQMRLGEMAWYLGLIFQPQRSESERISRS